MATLALGLAHKICCAGNPLFQHLGHSTGFCLILFVAREVAVERPNFLALAAVVSSQDEGFANRPSI
jgi:hypothetical protein